MTRHFPAGTLCLFLGVVAFLPGSRGAEPAALLDEPARQHLRDALWCLNMTPEDLAFAKDHGEPLWRLDYLAHLLEQPLDLCQLADRCRRELGSGDAAVFWTLAGDLLEAPFERVVEPPRRTAPPLSAEGLNPELLSVLNTFVKSVGRVDELLTDAFVQVGRAEAEYVTCASLATVFSASERKDVRKELVAAGITEEILARVLEEEGALDPEPAAKMWLEVTGRIKLSSLLSAMALFEQAAGRVRSVAAETEAGGWPDAAQRLATPYGDIWVGTPGPDVYSGSALLILDPGGDDRYQQGAGAASGLMGVRMALIVDQAGDDLYEGTTLFGPGAALFGVALVCDREGHDRYRAGYTGLGFGLFGCARVDDAAGDDVYQASALAEGAGIWGFGVLRDGAGQDRYDVGLQGQGFAGVRGFGALIDLEGHDLYYAGGRQADHERHDNHCLSLSQGMSAGARPFAGGGYGVLLDLAGNDVYQADVYGQGVAYWYAVGMLLDEAGDDVYRVYHYGQGSGIHLSLGLLADGGGDDSYTGHILAQGNAHDYAVGMLVEQGGNDTYTAHEHGQGRAINNGLALLLDRAGDDAYFGRLADQTQGIGNDGGNREYGSLALLLDLAGRDLYSCGAADGARLLRPDFGIVYDVKDRDDDEAQE